MFVPGRAGSRGAEGAALGPGGRGRLSASAPGAGVAGSPVRGPRGCWSRVSRGHGAGTAFSHGLWRPGFEAASGEGELWRKKRCGEPGRGRGARVRVTGVFGENSASACGAEGLSKSSDSRFVLIKVVCHCPRKKVGAGYQGSCSSRKTGQVFGTRVKNRNLECSGAMSPGTVKRML